MTRFDFVLGSLAALATAGFGVAAMASDGSVAEKAAACCCGEVCNCEECGCCTDCKDGQCTDCDDCNCEGCDCCTK